MLDLQSSSKRGKDDETKGTLKFLEFLFRGLLAPEGALDWGT